MSAPATAIVCAGCGAPAAAAPPPFRCARAVAGDGVDHVLRRWLGPERIAWPLEAGASIPFLRYRTLLQAYQNPAYVLPMSGYVGPTADMINRMRQQLGDELEGLAGELRKQGITVAQMILGL